MSDPFAELASEIEEITAARFTAAVGHEPEHDDLARSRCPRAGTPGHLMCGWCRECEKPVFICGHTVTP